MQILNRLMNQLSKGHRLRARRSEAVLPKYHILPRTPLVRKVVGSIGIGFWYIVFLDIRMPGLTGLEVARRAAEGVHVVFVTAHDQYAVEAFDRAAADYLLKPVTDERLVETVRRLRERLRAPPAQA